MRTQLTAFSNSPMNKPPVVMKGEKSVSSLRESFSSEVLIEKLVPGGNGLGRIGAQVVFVKGGLPEEKLRIRVGKKLRGVHHGEIEQILQPSVERTDPPCAIYGQCGGCQLQHINDRGQLFQKRAILADALERIAKIETPEIGMVVPSPQPFGYRSTIRFVVFKHAQEFKLGFYQAGTRNPVEAKACLLIPERVQQLVAIVAGRLSSYSSLPMFLEHVEFRSSTSSEDVLIIFHGTFKKTEKVKAFLEQFQELPEVIGCIAERSGPKVNRSESASLVVGQDYVTERFDELTIHIGFQSFTQTNWPVFKAIGHTLKDWVGGSEGSQILEVYAGTGALGMSLARNGAFVTLVEPNSAALSDARKSVALSRVARCKFKRQTAETFLPSVQSGVYNVIILDPPRTGLSPVVTKELGRIRAARLFYVSCDVATLARDLSRLATDGYRIVRIQPFDMFPQTAHIETLVELVA